MSQIIEFYNGSGTDHKGRSWAEIVSQTDEWLEETHDYIQFLFPLEESSKFNAHAPILTKEDMLAFREQDLFRKRLKTSFFVMLVFFGIEFSCSGTFQNSEIKLRKDLEFFEERSKIWISPNNHNYMRISRILKSLCLLGQRNLAEAFLEFLIGLKKEFDNDISTTNLEYWMEAVE